MIREINRSENFKAGDEGKIDWQEKKLKENESQASKFALSLFGFLAQKIEHHGFGNLRAPTVEIVIETVLGIRKVNCFMRHSGF